MGLQSGQGFFTACRKECFRSAKVIEMVRDEVNRLGGFQLPERLKVGRVLINDGIPVQLPELLDQDRDNPGIADLSERVNSIPVTISANLVDKDIDSRLGP